NRNEVLGLVAHDRCGNSLPRIAARFVGLFNHVGLIAPRVQIGVVALRLILDTHERGRKTCDLPLLGDHQRDRLAVELDLVIVERTKRRAGWRDLVVESLIGVTHLRPILVGEDVENAFDGKRLARVDALEPPARNRRGDDAAIGKVGSRELTRVLRHAGDLDASVNARGRSADIRFHDTHRIFLLDWICGVPFAACVSVRMMARRARSILKALCAKPLAPPSNMSAAFAKTFESAAWPRNAASASGLRHGLCATPPSTIRASLIRPPSSSRAAATETSANA